MDKAIAIRNHILSLLPGCPENGRLPSARKLAADFDVSFQFVQRVVDDLADRGVIQVFPRSGMSPHPYWKKRQVNGVFKTHADDFIIRGIQGCIAKRIPEIFISREFERAPMEMAVTHYLVSHHRQYCDLRPLLGRVVPENNMLFSKIVDAGKFGDNLCGIPLVFSPQVMLLNRRIFERCGCELPPEDWTWDDLARTAAELARHIEPYRALGIWRQLTVWASFVTVNGSSIVDPDDASLVKLDSPESIQALEFFFELLKKHAVPAHLAKEYNHLHDFRAGNTAIILSSCQTLAAMISTGVISKEDIVLRQIPVREKGMVSRAMLAANFYCVRKECVDMELAEELLRLLLSDECQRDIIGASGCGFHIMQTPEQQSFNNGDQHDAVFAKALSNVVPRYNITNPASYHLVCQGMESILSKNGEGLASEVARLADALRLISSFGDEE